MLNRNKNSINIDDYFPFSVLRMMSWCPSNLSQLTLNIKKLRSWIQPHPSWQIEGEKVEAVTDFFISVSKTTVDAACSHEIRGRLLLGRKAMRNINSVLRSRNIILPKKLVDIWAFHLDSSTFCPVPIGL